MSNGNGQALARVDDTQGRTLAKRDEAGFTESEVDLIKTQIAPGVTDGELKLFLHVCKSRRLDPFSRQIYAVVRKTWDPKTRTEKEKMTIMAAIDGMRLSGRRGGVEAIDEAEFEYDGSLRANDNPLGLVKATVRVWRAGVSRPTTGVAYWDEYRQANRDGKLTGKWGDMPRGMLAKCAEAQALRKAAPEELSGIYAAEEMDQIDNPPRDLMPIRQQIEAAPLNLGDFGSLLAAVDGAATLADLAKVAAQIKATPNLTPSAKENLRSEYARRSAELKPKPAAPIAEATQDVPPDSNDRGADPEAY